MPRPTSGSPTRSRPGSAPSNSTSTPATIDFRPAIPADAHWIAPRLRKSDRLEIWLQNGRPIVPAVHGAIAFSDDPLLIFHRGRFAAVAGVFSNGLMTGGGVPWMVGSDLVEAYPTTALRWSRAWVRGQRQIYGRLSNHVHDGHETAKQWLAWLGFTLDPPAPHGPMDALFRRFWME